MRVRYVFPIVFACLFLLAGIASAQNSNQESLLINSAPATQGLPPAPDWSEFCPAEYLNAQIGPVTASRFSRKKRHTQEERNYWAQRREQFQQEIKTCRYSPSHLIPCYMQIRQLQISKNSQHQQELQHKETLRQQRLNAIFQDDGPSRNSYHCSPDNLGGYNCY